MSLARRLEQKYTYQDYLNWPDDERWEIIDGEAYCMSPSPTIRHQRIVRKLAENLYEARTRLKGCEYFVAPTDVVLDEFNVVQPDIFIVCDKSKITENNIQSAPDLIFEIVSKSTAYKDTKIKKDLYERFGVKEYIIVFPDLEIVERYTLENNCYGPPERFNWNEVLKLKIFDLKIKLWEVFGKELPQPEAQNVLGPKA
jgi:Uma2 family endonuclease